MKARYFGLVCADLCMNLLGYALNWLFPAFATNDGYLPNWLKWFGQHDSTLDGDEVRFIKSTLYWRKDRSGMYPFQTPITQYPPRNLFCRYVLRVLWLYRNNAYGFSYYILGAPGPFEMISEKGTIPSDRYPAKEGDYTQVVKGADGKLYYQRRIVRDLGNGKCVESSMGWKLNGDLNKPLAQLVFRWTPFRTFEVTFP